MVFNTTFSNISVIAWRSVYWGRKAEYRGKTTCFFIAEKLLISISVERGRATLPRFFFTRGPTLKCMTMPWLRIKIGSKILSDEYSIIILTGRKITVVKKLQKCMTIGVHMNEFLNATGVFFICFSMIFDRATYCIQHFPSICFQSLYRAVNQCHLSQICVSLNYMVATNTILTLSILFPMGKVQGSTCLSCCTASQDMFHLWVTCP